MLAPELPAVAAPPSAWRPSARRRAAVLVLTLLAAGLAVAVVATGPAEPVSYGLRLPLLVIAGGTLVNATQWRRGLSITADEVIVRTLLHVRAVPLCAVASVETNGSRLTIRPRSGRKAVVRAVTGSWAADDLANAVVTAAPGARLIAVPPSAPAPVATPWVIMLLAVGVMLLSAEGYAADPALVTVALAALAVVSCAALGTRRLWRRG